MILLQHPDFNFSGLALGYWKNDHHKNYPDPLDYVGLNWDPVEQKLVAQYLESCFVLFRWRGSSRCHICNIRNGSCCFSDGVYVWPEGFAHYVRCHNVRPPEQFVQHVLKSRRYTKEADLSPALGRPGGPCHIVRRIEKEVSSPVVKEVLVDKVEDGKSLTNPEASKIYNVMSEKSRGLVIQFLIGPHTQYRMDLRTITVKDIQRAFVEWDKEVHFLRKAGHPDYNLIMDMLENKDKIKYTSPQNLTLVFAAERKGIVKILTTWWQSVGDPPAPGTCVL